MQALSAVQSRGTAWLFYLHFGSFTPTCSTRVGRSVCCQTGDWPERSVVFRIYSSPSLAARGALPTPTPTPRPFLPTASLSQSICRGLLLSCDHIIISPIKGANAALGEDIRLFCCLIINVSLTWCCSVELFIAWIHSVNVQSQPALSFAGYNPCLMLKTSNRGYGLDEWVDDMTRMGQNKHGLFSS